MLRLLTLLAASFAVSGPQIQVYKASGGTKLTAHVFRPAGVSTGRRPAVVLFHGGGWSAGSPEWVYDAARRYASYGAVAVAAEYRLSDQKTITPLDAMADARDVVRWMRRHASELGIDAGKIAAYGVSAGGHLAASLATFNDGATGEPSAVPNAMVLISPAVSLAQDGWFQRLLLGRAKAAVISPDEHVGKGMPPTAIFIGAADTLTPLSGAQHYCGQITALGGECELHVYEGVGHLFTRKLDNQESDFDPDPKAAEDARVKGDLFLEKLGFFNRSR
jgi:acetyl esterase